MKTTIRLQKLFKRTFLLSLTLAALSVPSCGTAKKAQFQEETLRIGTFNLWRSDIGKDEYAWANRKNKLAQAIVDNNFDIFAAEEVDTAMFRQLPALVKQHGGNYKWFTFSPYAADGKGSLKAQAIVYRADKFKMLEQHHFWSSETPDVMSSGWDEQKFKRGACCAIFKSIATGRKIFVMIGHFPLGQEARIHFAPIVIERAKKYNPDNLPAFLMGDLNTTEETPDSKTLRTYWTDSYLALSADKRKGPHGTFNSHNVQSDMEKKHRIDFVYFRGEGITPLNYVCNTATYDGIFPSDHCPIYTNFLIK